MSQAIADQIMATPEFISEYRSYTDEQKLLMADAFEVIGRQIRASVEFGRGLHHQFPSTPFWHLSQDRQSA